MIKSFSIPPGNSKDVAIMKEIQQYCLSRGLNFSAFVVTAIKEHYNTIRSNNEYR